MASCGTSCSGMCGSKCMDSCSGGCSSGCSGGCLGSCSGSCYGGSKDSGGSCSGCSGGCSQSCSGSCSNGCSGGCDGTSKGSSGGGGSGGGSGSGGNEEVVSKPGAASSLQLSDLDITATSVTINYSSISDATKYQFALKLTGDDSSVLYYTDSNSDGDYSYTITGLTANTNYTVNYRGQNSAGDGSFGTGLNFTTKAVEKDFDWRYAGYNSSGSLVSGTTKKQGYGFYVGADEWNDLIGNVKTKLSNRGMYSSSKYPMTTVKSGDTFKATYFNQVRFAIGSLSSTGLSDKSSGDEIKASDLNALRTAINKVTL